MDNVLTPLYKIPYRAAAFRLLKGTRYTCPSCLVKRPHWSGYIGGTGMVPYTYVCLRCGQVSADARKDDPLFHTIRIAVRTPSEARMVKGIVSGKANVWGGAMYVMPDGAVHMQWGSRHKAPIDGIDVALRAAGFRATWEEEQK